MPDYQADFQRRAGVIRALSKTSRDPMWHANAEQMIRELRREMENECNENYHRSGAPIGRAAGHAGD
jgi:hypothetical protein